MADGKKKNGISWEAGQVLDEGNTSPLGDIRALGLPKIQKAPAKDPEIRRQEREKFISEQQNKPYKEKLSQTPKATGKDVIVEESSSDIRGDFEDSEVKRLTDKGSRIQGLDRFGKK